MSGPGQDTAERDRVLVFVDAYGQPLVSSLDSLSPGSYLVLTRDVECFAALEREGREAFFLHDLLQEADVDALDRHVLELFERTFSQNSRFGWAMNHKGLPLGYFLNYYLIPYFMRLLRDVFLVMKALERFGPGKILVVGPGDLAEAARSVLSQRGIEFASRHGGRLRRLGFLFGEACRKRATQWRSHPLRDIFFEPLQFIVVAVYAKLFHRRLKTSEVYDKVLVFSADGGNLPFYERIKCEPGWSFLCCGTYYTLLRSRLSTVKPLESYLSLSDLFGFVGLMASCALKWWRLRRDSNFVGQFSYQGVSYWPSIKGLLMCNILINFPRVYVHHTVALRAFAPLSGRAALVIFAEEPPYYRATVDAAHRCNVKTVVIQHGLQAQSKASGLLSAQGKINTSAYAGWGQRTVDWMSDFNPPEALRRIVLTGAPRFDSYASGPTRSRQEVLKQYGLPEEGKSLLVMPSWYQDFSVLTTEREDLCMLEDLVKAVGLLGPTAGFHIIIKPHPSADLRQLERWVGLLKDKCGSVRIYVRSGDLSDFLSIAEVCISGYSTSLLEAMFFGKPCILYSRYYMKQYIEYVQWGAALGVHDAEGMAGALSALSDKDKLREKMSVAQKDFVKYAAGDMDGNCKERVIALVRGLVGGAA